MNFVDLKYINILSPRLKRFKKKSPSEFNFRCPYCGDSQKSSTKARGWIIEKKQKSFYYCHNCNISQSLYNLIKELDISLAREYYFESFKEKNNTLEIKPKPVTDELQKFQFEKPVFKKKDRLEAIAASLRDLDSNHIAIQYCLKRKIPKNKYEKLYYIDKFNKLDSASKLTDKRLVIPYYGIDGNLNGFTGRTLESSTLRYANISLNDDKLFFGTRDVDKNKTVYVVEGAIDSVFLPNSIGVGNSNLSRVSEIIDKEQCVLIPDREPRNSTIVNNISKFISLGFKVCLLPDILVGKDINEYIMNNTTTENLMEIINNNTYSGMNATLKLVDWKKV
jgi:transcription elongation factor Elf1